MNNGNSYKTSIKSFERLIFDDHSEKFNFLINICPKNKQTPTKQVHYETTLNKARVISSKVNQAYQIDPTITEYEFDISIDDGGQAQDIYNLISELFKSLEHDIEIREDQRKNFNLICFLLGAEHEEEFELSSEEESLSYLTTNLHSKSIEYLSRHFKEFITNGQWKNIAPDILKEIIDFYANNERKKVQNNPGKEEEDNEEEIEEVFNIMKSDEEYSNIVLYFLVQNSEYKYSEDMYKYIFDHLDDDVVDKELSQIIFIIRKFIGEHFEEGSDDCEQHKENKSGKKKTKTIDKKRYDINNIEYEGNELSGIFSYLNKNQQENSTDKKFEVRGGGEVISSDPIDNLFKYDSAHINDAYYNRNNKFPTSTDSWILFDFGQKRINLSSYTIRSNGCNVNDHAHPKTWTISGSNDCETWETINEQYNNPSLNGPHNQHRFECDKKDKYYRYIRYKQDDSWDNDKRFQYVIYLSCIEFFGSILTPTK